MGNRAYIQIDSARLSEPILLYGHWSGEDNLTAVRNVLSVTDRIGDPTYLTAQLFWEFAKLNQYDGRLGFGIDVGTMASDIYGDVPTVYVNADRGIYAYEGVTYEDYAVVTKGIW